MSTPPKRTPTYDAAWIRTYSRLITSTLLAYPEAKKSCFYCGEKATPLCPVYVVEVVVDHLAALDFRADLPIENSINHIQSIIAEQGHEAITRARHLVTTCSTCHIKLISIGWTR